MKSLCLVFALGPCLWAAPVATLEPYGGFVLKYGQVPIMAGDSLLLMDEHWKSVDRPMKEAVKLSSRGNRIEARYESALTTLTKTVINHKDGTEARWEFSIKPDARGRHIELCIGIQAAVLAELEPEGKTHGVLQSDSRLELHSFLGEFELDVSGSTSVWNLDDLRSVQWSKALRLRFAPDYDPEKGCKATAILRVKAIPSKSAAFLPLDIAAAGNRGLTDEVDGDGKGGWTDQGHNDLALFEPGCRTMLGLPFTVGKKAIILRGKERASFPAEAPPIPIGQKLARLYFLQTAAWPARWREPIADYEITYADGKRATVPVRNGIEVNDWWGASGPLEARLAWRGDNGSAQVGLYVMRWVNPRPEASIRTITVRSTNSGAVPILLGATGIRAGTLMMDQLAMLDKVFADRAEREISTEGWFKAPVAWNDGIQAGTALDASFLNRKPAGKFGFLRVRNGHFVFQNGRERPVRFWGTNAALYGPYPPQEDAPGIARCLARQGVNLVRLHLYAVYEDTLIAKDGSLNPEALNKFDFFIAELKKQGIYIYMDLNDGMFYDRLLGKKLGAPMRGLKMASLFNRELILAQKKLARALFTHKNPYTGLRLCDDAAIALYEITNENSLTSNWGSLESRLPAPYFAELEQKWAAWLEQHGKPVAPLGRNLGDASADARQFGAELQRTYLDEMYDFLRGIGVQAPICGTNITFTLGDLWASERMDFMNDHAYWDHPNVRSRPMTYNNRNAVRAPASSLTMVPRLARAKVRGKPLVASEWNYCFPNDYRCEGLPAMAAYAAYQDWDGLLFYCATGSFDGGRWKRFHERPGILVHSQQTDPATWGLTQVCALLFRRGDIQRGTRQVTLSYDKARVWENRSVLDQMPFLPALARLQTELVTSSAKNWFMDQPASLRSSDLYPEVLSHFENKSSSMTTIVSDTGQIRRNAAAGILTINSPRTQIATGFLASIERVRLNDLEMECQTRFATIALTSLEPLPIRESRRLLLAAVANARNADTRVAAHRLFEMGKGPVLAQPVTCRITLRSEAAHRLKVHALDTLSGRRKGPIKARAQSNALVFDLTPSAETIYYEIEE